MRSWLLISESPHNSVKPFMEDGGILGINDVSTTSGGDDSGPRPNWLGMIIPRRP